MASQDHNTAGLEGVVQAVQLGMAVASVLQLDILLRHTDLVQQEDPYTATETSKSRPLIPSPPTDQIHSDLLVVMN